MCDSAQCNACGHTRGWVHIARVGTHTYAHVTDTCRWVVWWEACYLVDVVCAGPLEFESRAGQRLELLCVGMPKYWEHVGRQVVTCGIDTCADMW